jgi:prepilin-type N-terminal cleavage/methylation domain-containing protein
MRFLQGRAALRRPRSRSVGGFTVLELLIVLLVVSVTLSIATQRYGRYLERTAAKRAAQIFAQDLVLARTSALRERQPAALVFLGGSREYVILVDGVEVARRSYTSLSEVHLSFMELVDPPDDRIDFSARGIADLGGGASLGRARFGAGRVTWQARFNAMGAAQISEEP